MAKGVESRLMDTLKYDEVASKADWQTQYQRVWLVCGVRGNEEWR